MLTTQFKLLCLPFEAPTIWLHPRPHQMAATMCAWVCIYVHAQFDSPLHPDVQVNAVRVYVNSSSENLDYPVLVVVRQQKEVLSWQVPLLFQGL